MTKQPPDDAIDFSDIPEITDFSKGVRGKYHPRTLALEAENERLRAALRDLYAYTVDLEGGMAPWVATRPGMAHYPGTHERRKALGERVRELLDHAAG